MNLRTLLVVGVTGLCLSLKAGENPVTEDTVSKQNDAISAYFAQKRVAQKDYRKRLSDLILKADKVELYLLDFAMPEVENSGVTGIETFPVTPFAQDTRIIQKKELNAEQMKEFCTTWAFALPEHGGLPGVICHYPVHGIKMYRGGMVVFQTSLCWHCANYYVEYPDGAAFETMGGEIEEVKRLFMKLLPVPPAETKRFEKMQAGMSGKGQKAKKDAKK